MSIESWMPKSAPACNLPRLPAQQPVYRCPRDGAFESPPEYLHRSLRERVALEHRQPVVQVLRDLVLAPDDVWPEHLRDVIEHRSRALRQVRRREERRRLRPRRVVAARGFHQHAVDVVVLPVGRPPRVDKRHLHVVHVESVDLHGASTPSDSGGRRPQWTRQLYPQTRGRSIPAPLAEIRRRRPPGPPAQR